MSRRPWLFLFIAGSYGLSSVQKKGTPCGAPSSASKKSDHDRYRSASYGWTPLSARQSAADFAKSCGTYACTARFGVGVDAYIDPADCTVFTVICGEFATSRRADVGIGPYRVLREFTAAHRADRGVRPYASLGNPTQNRKTIVF